MKKNLILGAFGGVLAIGASIGSTVFVVLQYVKISTVPPTSNCKQVVAEDCGQLSNRACEVLIESIGVFYPAYANSACTSIITSNHYVNGQFVNP